MTTSHDQLPPWKTHDPDACPNCTKTEGCPEWGKIRLRNRADRLRRLVELDAPEPIIANEVVLIIKGLHQSYPNLISNAQNLIDELGLS